MATTGDRYEERTGNIWSYSHRGDLTGLKAALARGVDVNMVNTVGWTPCHAAAAGGQNKALRLLVKAGADFSVVDHGGDLPVHQAAKNGHAHVLKVLRELGADVSKVRLSHVKGKAVRAIVMEAYHKDGRADIEQDEEVDVGYARKQSKSTAFWGPRRTPISCKLKKKILKEKRKVTKDRKKVVKTEDLKEHIDEPAEIAPEKDPSYLDTVQQVKRNKKHRGRQKQRRNITPQLSSNEGTNQGTKSSAEDDSGAEDDSVGSPTVDSVGGRFSALALLPGENDSD